MADDNAVLSEPKLVPGISCAKCGETQVVKLKPNGISRNPGFRCLACNTQMRGTTVSYMVVVILGLGLLSVASGLVKPFGDVRDQQVRDLVLQPMGAGSAFFMIPLYIALVGYSVRELFRPYPTRSKTADSKE